MDNNMTLKEYLLSQGINSKQESFERNVKIENNCFKIKLEKKVKDNLSELTIKEVFILAYKSLIFLKSVSKFSIIYLAKNTIIEGGCIKLSDNKFEITLSNNFEYNEESLNNEKNIVIVDKIDDSVEIEIL